jgi:nitrite reductase (cytochrome c-552)
MKLDKSQTVKLIVSVLVVVLALLCLGGLLGGKDLMYHLQHRGDLGPLTRSDIEYLEVDAPEATSKDGTVTAADWAAVYPYIAVSMGDNEKNSYVTDYLEQDPYLTNIYEGYGFAIDYGSARGHSYTLTDVAKTQRPHAKACCITCKTPNFAKMVSNQGVIVYSMPFDEVFAQMEEPISCYTCHANNAGNKGELTVTHSYARKALG